MIKNIALIAHDRCKPVLARFLNEHIEWVPGVNFLATGRTATALENAGLDITHKRPARDGGYIEITELIEKDGVDMLFFFVDPEVERPYHIDIQRMIDTGINKNIPMAFNESSAQLLLLGRYKAQSLERFQRKNAD